MADDHFEADWLDLREPADHRSRSRSLVTRLRREGRERGWSRIVDLGAGAGSNVRYLAGRIPWAREWTVVDHDEALLTRISSPEASPFFRRVVGDLAEEGIESVEGCHVVTASALLDLVSAPWLDRLSSVCARSGSAAYFALSYDGTVAWADEDEDDVFVLAAVNEHQRREKGLGRALGPDAPVHAERAFADAGYRTFLRPSPWRLKGWRDARLAVRLVSGWVDAAVEVRPREEERIRAWGVRRSRALSEGRGGLRVGHMDLLALPAGAGGARAAGSHDGKGSSGAP